MSSQSSTNIRNIVIGWFKDDGSHIIALDFGIAFQSNGWFR